MIEIAKLEKMVQAELAADGWWHDLSKKEQQAYIKAHPGSKFAKSRKLAGGNANAKKMAFHAAMTDSHRDAAAWHQKMSDKHSKLAGGGKKNRGAGVGDPNNEAAYLHQRAADAHEKARVAHDDALHIDMGNATMRATHEARGASRAAYRTSKRALGDSVETPKSKNYVGGEGGSATPNFAQEAKRHAKMASHNRRFAKIAEAGGRSKLAEKHYSAAGFHRSAAEHYKTAHAFGKYVSDGTARRGDPERRDRFLRLGQKHGKRADAMSSRLGVKQ